MLIKALCDYYDLLSAKGLVLPEGYSNVKIHYKVCLTKEGRVGRIVNFPIKEEDKVGKNTKGNRVAKDLKMPQRTQKTGIDANIVEHRPLYIFGLNAENGELTPLDRTGKAQKSHQLFVKTNEAFIEGVHSPIVDAYRAFLNDWNPQEETQNRHLLDLKKDYAKSGFAFCLMGNPDTLLHEDEQLKQKWEKYYKENSNEAEEGHIAQCAISGERMPIARIHNKIRGVYGGLTTGSVLVGFKNVAEQSYGNEQSYNSNISETAMKKYTEALNYLLNGTEHKMLLDDMTILFWAMDTDGECEDKFQLLLTGASNQMNAEQTEQMLNSLFNSAKKGEITKGRIETLDVIKENVDFYMIGLKPNSSRLALKFIYRKKYADVLWNIAKFHEDMQVTENLKPVPLFVIKKELISPKSGSDTVNPELMTKLFESIIYGRPYPMALLNTVVRRVRTDGGDSKINKTRVGLIKACLNRNYEEEEFNVALNKENHGQAYLCGRLFAVLEKQQEEASGNSLNRTIKDAYFASASSTPAIIFPRLLKLAQYHKNKSKSKVFFYKKLIQEIISDIDGKFPDVLSLKKQGEFIIGYYQQYQDFFKQEDN